MFVREEGAVVDELEAVVGVTVCAEGWFSNTSPLQLHTDCIATDMAAEHGLTHLRDERRQADHHAVDGDELVNV